MAITSMTRFKSDKTEKMIKNAKQAKKLVEKYGAEFGRLSRFHTGVWVGEWLFVTRYPSWEVYGKAQEGLAKDPAWAKLLADTAGIAEIRAATSLSASISDNNMDVKRPPVHPGGRFLTHLCGAGP
jgi:hypothetical protein